MTVSALALLLAACLHEPPAAPLPTYGSTATLAGERLTSGTLESRLVQDDAHLALFYAAEQKGSLETCGCPKEPRGGLPRTQAYIDASRAANPDTPSLLLNAGYWLEDAIGLGGALRGDVPVMNRWMIKGLAAGDWAALNVGYTDLPGLSELGSELGSELESELPLVSANVKARSDAVPAVAPWLLLERGGLRIGVTGITAAGVSFVPSPDYLVEPPVPAAEAVLAELAPQADLLVLLVYQAIAAARELAEAHPEIDVVIDAHQHYESIAPFLVGRAVWVKAQYQTQRLGELRLWMNGGDVERVLDRKIELDPDIPGDAQLNELMIQAHQEIDKKSREIFGD